jgi:hypothetical protein
MLHIYRALITVLIAAMAVPFLSAQDTITVRTLTFQDTTKRSGTWLFPPPQSYEKILMEYTLKCDAATQQDRFPCGEWDYLTYTVLTDSTGQYDSTSRSQVNFVVNGSTPTSYSYSTTPVPQRYRIRETSVNRVGGGDTWADIASGGTGTDAIIRTTGSRARYLYKASELTAAGLAAGPITGIRIRALDSVNNVETFTVRLGQTTENTITNLYDVTGLTTVVRRSILLDDGNNDLPFHSTFTWDGTSNIIVELSCFGASANGRLNAGPAGGVGLQDDESRYAYEFKRGDVIEIPNDIGSKIDKEITVVFWSYGDPAVLPANHNVLEAFDAQDRRVLNIHLPWSNGNVYWDAGRDVNNGALDRLEKAASAVQTEGRWNHWAFVKDRNGNMFVYVNGELFHSGNGKTRPMSGITRFMLGAGKAGAYPGMLDEVQIWNKALDQSTITTWMKRRVTDLHTDYNNLIAYYNAENDANAMTAFDNSLSAYHAAKVGVPTRVDLFPDHRGYTARTAAGRPFISLENGPANTVVLYSETTQPRVYRHDAVDHPTRPIDTLTVQQAGWLPVIDEDGLVVDSFQVAATVTIQRKDMLWYDPVVDFEIGRFITPYGIGLDLGPNGFKWVYDVTEYAPLLRNNVTLRAGNQQELIDLTFKFIKGTPPRDVLQIKQLWSDRNAEFTNISNGNKLKPVDVKTHSGANYFTVKAISSGHRFDNPTNCAEFCKRNHYIDVAGKRAHTWLLWTECGDNPVYPQGGTWLIDRAGWCPGAPVDEYVHDITPLVTPGATATIDYGVETQGLDDTYGVWDVTGQLFGYGPAKRTLDLAIDDVIRPSTWEFYQRLNPICGNPRIVIRNLGSTTVTSATIECYTVGSAPKTYEWTGSLKFMETDTVDLPIPEWNAEITTNNGRRWVTFTTRITKVNSTNDTYEGNNSINRVVPLPDVYYSDLQIVLRTNNFAAQQYEWTLKKADGTVIQSESGLADNTTYEYDFTLEDGCYDFELVNKEGYGLDFWFLRDQLGTGSLQFKSGGKVIKNFTADFGNRAWIQFSVAPKPTIQTDADTLYFIAASPIPVERTLTISSTTSAPLTIDSVSVFALSGHYSVKSTSRPLPATLAQGETMTVVVVYNRPDVGKSNGTLRLYSNDERDPLRLIRLVGEITTTSVDEESMSDVMEVGVIPNPVTSHADIVVSMIDPTSVEQVTIQVVDVLGSLKAEIHDGRLDGHEARFAVPIGLPSGHYRVVVRTASGMLSVPFVVTH